MRQTHFREFLGIHEMVSSACFPAYNNASSTAHNQGRKNGSRRNGIFVGQDINFVAVVDGCIGDNNPERMTVRIIKVTIFSFFCHEIRKKLIFWFFRNSLSVIHGIF